ncbi:amidophosphoribosyltransferase [Piscirickettsia salmonis]|uniref:amidophosphoribosyltransferase n=1 Tax=Piscirickettsia salmonis TaxID=1238 RepID=UPI000F0736D2|nr:amidophosphoribosyltransferase [Piscirickettsiaceae bacterium NZ-RLO2]
MCGIVGLVGHYPVGQALLDGLTMLQHRGQDAAGILTASHSKFYLRKSNGLVRDVFNQRQMTRLEGQLGIGHVRYPTAGSSDQAEAQPFYVNSPYGIALAHNGNLTNAKKLKEELFRTDRRHVNTGSDSEVLLNVLAHEMQGIGKLKLSADDIFYAVERIYDRCKGGFSALAVINGHGLLAFRDPNGIRPLVYGTRQTAKGTEHMFASENVALDMLGFELQGDVAPGEAVYISEAGDVHRRVCADNACYTPCIFEYVYLARPDSVMNGISIYQARINMGEHLAKRVSELCDLDQIDAVIPVPDSSRTSAFTLSQVLGLPYREGFVKNHYVGRTFIMPDQALRRHSVRRKLNTINTEFAGKNVLLVDDSIVRGTTSREIIQMAREAGAKKVFFASAAPEVMYPNVYGIDMPVASELVAHGKTLEEIKDVLGADQLIFQTLKALNQAVAACNEQINAFDSSVFDGKYVTQDIDSEYLARLEQERTSAKKNNEPDIETVNLQGYL